MELENTKLKVLLVKRGELVEKGRKISVNIEKEQLELNKLQLQIQKNKDKMVPLVDSLDIDLKETEQINKIELKKGKIIIDKYDVVAEYKRKYLKKKYEQANASTTTKKSNAGGKN